MRALAQHLGSTARAAHLLAGDAPLVGNTRLALGTDTIATHAHVVSALYGHDSITPNLARIIHEFAPISLVS